MDFMKNKWFNNYTKSFIIAAENYVRLYLMTKNTCYHFLINIVINNNWVILFL